MSDKLFPLPLDQFLEIILHELDHKDSYFGIPGELFFNPERIAVGGQQGVLRTNVFRKEIHTPLGVAAGPHSQMAQNIVAAWLLGARYIELKTIQTLDDLEVAKPCIDMQDEGYNCEWSQELKIQQSFDEYLNAWIIIHILNHRFGWSVDPGAIFNMSAGYNMEGILKDNVQWFLDKMAGCSSELHEKKESIRAIYPSIDEVHIPGMISDNITLSTMHGCPAHEIEDIASYLLKEKKLHTYVKLNPTLLGPEKLREILNNTLGFNTIVPDQAFEHDLQYKDAQRIIRNLHHMARKTNLDFGLKLTNTLESLNNKSFFGSQVKYMYMSGRALHPLSVTLAHRLQEDFDGRLQLSFSGGADAFNAGRLLECGFKTITVCTDLLKPGGMMRLPQYLENILGRMEKTKAENLTDLIHSQPEGKPSKGLNGQKKQEGGILKNLKHYASEVLKNKAYQREYLVPPDIKTSRPLGIFDCISAPCRDTCATLQDIPEYMLYTAREQFSKAHGVILRTNPFPAVTGMICDHLCQNKCTRVHYDNPLLIREVKRFNAWQPEPALQTPPKNGLKTAIIGAGPAGLSCAYFLALAGFSVEVYESASRAGGMVRFAIPGFRLTTEALEKDLDRIASLGVSIHYNTKVDKTLFDQLRNNADYVFVGTGAPLAAPLPIEGHDAAGVLDPLDFLFRVRAGQPVKTGNQVVIIGGGNTAMDAARTAYRLVGKSGTVTIVYRRTINEMPADQGEIKAAMAEGVKFMELCGPEEVLSHEGRVCGMRAVRMRLEKADSSGRPRPVKISGTAFDIACDTIIPAIGQIVETGFMDNEALNTFNGSYHTRMDQIFTGGDAMRGASTAINAIGDGRKAAKEIIKAAGLEKEVEKLPKNNPPGYREIMVQRAKRSFAPAIQELPLTERRNFKLVQPDMPQKDIVREAKRCLHCDQVCNTCVSVCPNLANFAYQVKPFEIMLQKAVRQADGKTKIANDELFSLRQQVQILNIADFCNECGNCRTFCPTADAPYQTKPKIHLGIPSFYDSDQGYYLSCLENSHHLIGKQNGQRFTLMAKENQYVFETSKAIVTLEKNSFRIKDVQFLSEDDRELRLQQAAIMKVILQGAKQLMHI